jgi:hypothetical protein
VVARMAMVRVFIVSVGAGVVESNGEDGGRYGGFYSWAWA